MSIRVCVNSVSYVYQRLYSTRLNNELDLQVFRPCYRDQVVRYEYSSIYINTVHSHGWVKSQHLSLTARVRLLWSHLLENRPVVAAPHLGSVAALFVVKVIFP